MCEWQIKLPTHFHSSSIWFLVSKVIFRGDLTHSFFNQCIGNVTLSLKAQTNVIVLTHSHKRARTHTYIQTHILSSYASHNKINNNLMNKAKAV